jgi:hypothetical protein
MKILNIKNTELNGEKIIVEVEGYPHAQPVFNADIDEKTLKEKLLAWKINQDKVDEINRQAILNIKPVTEIKQELKDLENREI